MFCKRLIKQSRYLPTHFLVNSTQSLLFHSLSPAIKFFHQYFIDVINFHAFNFADFSKCLHVAANCWHITTHETCINRTISKKVFCIFREFSDAFSKDSIWVIEDFTLRIGRLLMAIFDGFAPWYLKKWGCSEVKY